MPKINVNGKVVHLPYGKMGRSGEMAGGGKMAPGAMPETKKPMRPGARMPKKMPMRGPMVGGRRY